MSERCDECKFWARGPGLANGNEIILSDTGECRIRDPAEGWKGGRRSRLFPITAKGDWCGMHLAILPAILPANVTPIRKA